MKNITLSAREEAIEKARKVAASKNSSLNVLFREWLESFNNQEINDKDAEQRLRDLWNKTNYFRAGKKFTREEMNER